MAGKGLRLGIGWRLGIIVVAAVERLGIGGAVPAGPHPNLRVARVRSWTGCVVEGGA